MVDDSKLRLRARRNASISLEEGTLDPSRAVETPSSNLPMAKNNKSSADNLRALLGSPMYQDVSNGLGRIRGRVKRRRRRQVFYKACRLFIGGLAAAIVTAILSVGLLPFSWTQVDYHHQLQNEVQYVYQKIYDNRQNYHSVVDNYHPNGMSPMHNKHHHIHRGGPSDFQGPMDNEGDAESIQNNFGPSNSPKQNLRRKKSAYLELEDHDTSEENEKDAPSKTIVENHTTSGAHEIFHCTDGTVGFKNDDYCDCVDDGLDEPDTSACSHILVTQRMFQCGRQENREDGEKIVWIFTSRVNDGIKDCPDGSDEYGWR